MLIEDRKGDGCRRKRRLQSLSDWLRGYLTWSLDLISGAYVRVERFKVVHGKLVSELLNGSPDFIDEEDGAVRSLLQPSFRIRTWYAYFLLRDFHVAVAFTEIQCGDWQGSADLYTAGHL